MQPALNAPRPKNDAKWTANFNKLEAFKTVNGNLNIPANHELYGWTSNQRSARSNPKSTNKLTKERIALLDGLGFVWNLQEALWTANFKTLEAFKAVNGHLDVPKGHELYGWTKNQRSARNNPKSKHKLTEERIALLDGLGFNWR
jgi:hypothetical protein